jgi:hypothetical protein
MDRNNIAKFIDEQIEENARDLRNIQIKVQKYEQILVLCLSMYLKSSLSFDFLLKASLSGFFKDTRLDYIAFQKARINYNNSNNCKRLIEDVAICIKTSKKLEKIIRQGYAELAMVKEENYNMKIFSTHMLRDMRRFEELMDTDTQGNILDSLIDDE